MTRLASATDYALRFAAEKWSVKPDRDFAVLQLGGQPEMMAALKSGAVQEQCSTRNSRFWRREGYRDLADVGSMGLTFPGSGPPAVPLSVTGGRRCCGLCVLIRTVFTTDELRRASLLAFWQSISRTQIPLSSNRSTICIGKYIPQVPYPSVEAMKRALDDIAEKDPRGRGARPEQFIDASLMQELEKEGFIKQLALIQV